jgi:curved DNA-binding protein
MRKNDYYQILKLNRETTDEEIKRSYRLLALQYHPDRNPMDKEAEEKFKEISEAYSVLGDADKRSEYDYYGHTGFGKHYSSEDISNFRSGYGRMRMNSFFGRGMGCRKRARFWKGDPSHFGELNNFRVDGNATYRINITPEESVYGTERMVIARTRWGEKSYRFTIPAGTSDGTSVKLSLKDEDYNAHNIYIQINVKE